MTRAAHGLIFNLCHGSDGKSRVVLLSDDADSTMLCLMRRSMPLELVNGKAIVADYDHKDSCRSKDVL